ncbi:MAG: AtpZ/AtpI family protein [Bacteroidia bacterium]|nr:AtpZ/AtpI family protein [Bacteroidia bacterium]
MKDKKEEPTSFLRYSSLGLQLMVSIGLAAWAGLTLDQFFELKFPVFLLLLVLLSFAGSMYQLYRSLNK